MHILVPLDGSFFAERALTPVFTLAQHLDEPLTLVLARIDPSTTFVETPPSNAGTIAAYAVYLDAIRHRADMGHIACTIATAQGLPETAICTLADRKHSDLIVMASHILSRADCVGWGSVAEYVAHQSGIPTLIVRPSGNVFPPRERAQPFMVLIPLDGSAQAETALRAALPLVRAAHGTIMLLYVVTPPNQRDERGVLTYLHNLTSHLNAQGVHATSKLESGSPATLIPLIAARMHADLIVMATQQHDPHDRAYAGSIAAAVFHQVAVPLLFCSPRAADRAAVTRTTSTLSAPAELLLALPHTL